MEAIYELAINQVKAGRLTDFYTARQIFITQMKKAEGVGQDGFFESFFTMPGENETEVFVGVTEWGSSEMFANAARQLMPTDAFKDYFQTFDQLAYLQVQPEDGYPFNLQDIMEDGLVVEFAVRKTKAGREAVFPEKRKGFFDLVAAQNGYLFDREFVTVDGTTRAVIIAWESMADFQAALVVLSQKAEMADFMSIVEVQAYQAVQLASNQ